MTNYFLSIMLLTLTRNSNSFFHRPLLSHLARRRYRSYQNHALSMSSTTTTDTCKVALLQFRVTESKPQNHQTAIEYLSQAASQNAQLAILPEIWNGPYATSAFGDYAELLPKVGDTLESWKGQQRNDDDDGDDSSSSRLLMERANELNMWIVGGSIPERDDTKLYNTCLCIDPTGRIVGKHRKIHLFDINVPGKITFFESDTLSPGRSLTSFDTPFGKIGIGICYDLRFPELASCLVERGCTMLVYPGAFNLTTGPAHWELLQRARALDGQCFVVTCSQARSEEQESQKYPYYAAWGHSTVVSPWGDVLQSCDEKECVLVVDLDLKRVKEVRESIPTMEQKRGDLYEVVDLELRKNGD